MSSANAAGNGGIVLEARGELGVKPDYVISNDIQRARLLEILDRMSDEDLGRRMPNGNSVADILIHLAFWDRYTLDVLTTWQRDGFSVTQTQFESINAAILMLAEAIPLRAAVELVRTSAEAVDREVETVPADLAATIVENGKLRSLERAQHRVSHLDQIEGLLATS